VSEPTRDRVSIIFGATGGIGSALATRLLTEEDRQGARLVLVSRQPTPLDNLVEELRARYPQQVVTGRVIESTDPSAVESLLEEVGAEYGRVDGVANCVGSLLLKPIHLTTEAEWVATLQTNLGSAFAVTRAAIKTMLRTGQTGGSIALVSSAASQIGLANHEAIAAAKGAINGLVLAAAATYAPRGIRVNAVAPGLVRTPLTGRITGNEASLKASVAMHALGRIGEPDEVASGLAWFLHPSQSWVTGQILGIDGGLGSLRSR
jgi:3-oxoacyl-[acyl-carrier protein] reductase